NLSQSHMRLCRGEFVSRIPAQVERLAEAVASFVQLVVAARLVTACNPLNWGGRIHWASVACGRIEQKGAWLADQGPGFGTKEPLVRPIRFPARARLAYHCPHGQLPLQDRARR